MTDKFPYQLCEWQKKLSDLDSILETLIKYNEPYKIRYNNIEGKYNASWEDNKYCWAVFTSGKGILIQNDYKKNGYIKG